ncbi:NUDIX hydrolase domain-like protein [Pavlovales sp. CCMP2436]|nr:NUDIX hydrolase domain-like protein [Pavlovales sp. CCMP2436]|mmetsp:Transcript_3927/g.9972  ORF Transcript_3927/g.9972 Transcript_3927/m.9972 type:complete len:230 (-) Transcript_3927:210-899(-)|eukprot:CAMPEP_0179868274 /NCGR_PEP_ID=MMETSP0982-20121206/18737_1 /TAXON_ID=483367 /ORGANISM="non described non described, Strain CCMP 2436" /LENGTH=229 /DNA_ID=CAMNT_0021757931 /DNA_START=110 /DNA_END=799 /DNA_ORIENTATION=-
MARRTFAATMVSPNYLFGLGLGLSVSTMARGLSTTAARGLSTVARTRGRPAPVRVPRAAVATTVVRVRPEDNVHEFLLVQRENPPCAGSWSIPGGKTKLGETTLAAAAREIAEETGLGRASGLKYYPWSIASSDVIVRDPQNGRLAFHYVIAQLLAFVRSDAQAVAGDDASAVMWVTLAELEQGKLELGGNVYAIFKRAEHLLQTGAATQAEAIEVEGDTSVPDYLVER